MGGSPIHRSHPNGIADLHVARLRQTAMLCLVRRTPSALGERHENGVLSGFVQS